MAHIEKRGERTYRIKVRPSKFETLHKTIKAPEGLTGKALQVWLEQQAAAFELEVRTGRYAKPKEKITVEEFSVEWFRHKVKIDYSSTTQYTYDYILRAYVLPFFRHKKLSAVTQHDIIKFLQNINETNLSHNSKAVVWRVVKNLFKTAWEWKYIPFDLTDGIKGILYSPNKQKTKGVAWSKDQIKIFIQAMHKEDIKLQAFLSIALFGGLRRGEILGLTWHDVNFEEKIITINKTVVDGINGKEIKEPKTKGSVRTISMPDLVINILHKYRKVWLAQRIETLQYWRDKNSAFLFHNGLGEVLHPDAAKVMFKRFLQKHGLPNIRLHDLRHISASALIMAGVPVRVVADRLGHASPTTTQTIYAHVIRHMDQAAADIFDKLFSDGVPNGVPSEGGDA